MSETTLPHLDPSSALEVRDDGRAVLIDVREPEEWTAGHAPQAEHRPLSALDPAALERGVPVVTDAGERGIVA